MIKIWILEHMQNSTFVKNRSEIRKVDFEFEFSANF